MVPYFKKYHIDPDNFELPHEKQIKTGKMMANFNPETDAIDRRILYEITRRKKDP